MHPAELTFYKALVLIASAAAIGFGITNIVYFNNIRLNPDNCQQISSGTATMLIWLNIILVILGAVVFFWSLFRLIFTGETKKEVVNKTYNTHTHNYPASPVPVSPSPYVAESPTGATIASYPSSPII